MKTPLEHSLHVFIKILLVKSIINIKENQSVFDLIFELTQTINMIHRFAIRDLSRIVRFYLAIAANFKFIYIEDSYIQPLSFVQHVCKSQWWWMIVYDSHSYPVKMITLYLEAGLWLICKSICFLTLMYNLLFFNSDFLTSFSFLNCANHTKETFKSRFKNL